MSWAGSFFTTEPPEKLLDTWSNISLETPGTFGVRKCGQLLRLRKEEETRMGGGALFLRWVLVFSIKFSVAAGCVLAQHLALDTLHLLITSPLLAPALLQAALGA